MMIEQCGCVTDSKHLDTMCRMRHNHTGPCHQPPCKVDHTEANQHYLNVLSSGPWGRRSPPR